MPEAERVDRERGRIGCMRDVVYRFIDAATDDDAKAVDAACAQSIPRPTVFLPVRAAGEGSP